jgi:hypothetical protein
MPRPAPVTKRATPTPSPDADVRAAQIAAIRQAERESRVDFVEVPKGHRWPVNHAPKALGVLKPLYDW